MPNSIHNLDTKRFRNDTGEFPAIVMGLTCRWRHRQVLSRSRRWAIQEPTDVQPTDNGSHDNHDRRQYERWAISRSVGSTFR